MIIDFRLRPPFEDYINLGMYKNLARCAAYAKSAGFETPQSLECMSMPLLLEEMDEHGISMGVATGRVRHFAGGMSNDIVVRLVEKYPGRFVGFAGLDPLDWRWSIAEIHRLVADGPLAGVVLEPGAARPAVRGDDAILYPIYAECEKLQVPVMVMLGGNAGPNVDYSFPAVIHKIAADFPGVKFIVSHGGWPWVQPVLGVCFLQPNIWLSPDLYMFNQPGFHDYVMAANTFMQDRFLFASAYPFLPVACVEKFKTFFNPDVLPKLLYKNACKLLNLNIQEETEATRMRQPEQAQSAELVHADA